MPPIDASIPLQVKPTQMMDPGQLLSLQNVMRQGQMQDEQLIDIRRKREVNNALRAAMSEPGALDEKGQPTPETQQKVMGIDPATGLKMRADYISTQEKLAQTEKATNQARAALDTIDRHDREIISKIQLGAHELYENSVKGGMDPAQATKQAQDFVSSRLSEEDKLGVLNKKYITGAQPWDYERSKVMVAAMRPLKADGDPNVAPRMRTRINGTTEIQEQWNPQTNKWDQVGKGPRFARQVPPVVVAGGASKPDFGGQNGELMAALAERGVTLPAGFRSKEQQAALLTSLWKRNPNATADDIADKVKTGQIDINNLKAEGRTAGNIAGKIRYAENELENTIPLVREASAKLPRGEFVPYNKLKQMGEAAFSNPDLAEFKMYMTTLSNAYDMLAARSGTDMEKRREGRKNFETAASPEALERVLRAVQKEAKASGAAADKSLSDVANQGKAETPQRRSTDNDNDPLGIRR